MRSSRATIYIQVQNNMKQNSSTKFLPKVHLLRSRAQCGQIGHDGTSDYENLGQT